MILSPTRCRRTWLEVSEDGLLRAWFNGRTPPCQGGDRSSILRTRTKKSSLKRLAGVRCARSSRSETDITTVFGTVIPGSNPGGSNEQVGERVAPAEGRGRETGVSRGGRSGKTVAFPLARSNEFTGVIQ